MTEEQKPLEILVIDDDTAVRKLLKNMLDSTGANATTAVDGQEGIDSYLERLKAGTPYDTVFTDLSMPDVTGVDVTMKVKEVSPKTPVYVITGREGNNEYNALSDQLKELKPDDVIPKPFRMGGIINLINQIKLYKSGAIGEPPKYQPPTP